MNKLFAALLCVFLFLPHTMSSADAKAEASAREAAEKWLALVDAGKYPESWDVMSVPFKKEVSKKKWRSMIEEIRRPLGKKDARKIKSTEYTKELPGAPDGEHVVAKFETVFSNKPAAVETVTLLLGQNLIWRVSSYAVK